MPPQSQHDVLERSPDAEIKPPEGRAVIVWGNVALFAFLHIGALYGLYIACFYAKWGSIVFILIALEVSGLGVTAGAHRLWCHRAYKAKFPLRVFLMLCNNIALQNSVYEWSRDHRVHHKFSETDADPTNIKRGLFFSHIGWLMSKKHPEVIRKGKTIDCSDLLQDPVLIFQRRYYVPLATTFCFILPTVIPHWLFDESYWNAFFACAMFRYVLSLHVTWLVNGVAHLWGTRPYDKSIAPAENILVSAVAAGEGFHNYHHAFPWDYSTSEMGWKWNITTMFIDAMAALGLAYDLKTASKSMVQDRINRTGDGMKKN
ncbi:acyl-CoA Delta-9 desaturase-like [Ornithodoros turicata]|uniref:acyl-CoA Delta-9 desaturase-like n=1 Tax=Ornithodoros turicata TaxID=34597 RepID=UPI00313968D6